MQKTLQQILDEFGKKFNRPISMWAMNDTEKKWYDKKDVRLFIKQEITELLNSLVPEEKEYVNKHLKFGYDRCREELKDKINNILK